ncbi:probable serine hydrolase isoform X2 [Zootermopsis nevadensis]|nr:probable serine hydrolase isoform X2 [Zootermopsis nevadensis]XP_021919936.1 probable serine hydrolase isoform X2 [Zootermopsis nevadensis]XP_021919937.1 probable serine hydrolase isoform X2 [Zootermopsis nevadensis]XP_021919938.1 probable serine hydrolase isoform X2 [Zootermopsis nevadensis]XP_021919939.1 probable serine hydrolase isoform X2 [Zootermopsis nevadensis]
MFRHISRLIFRGLQQKNRGSQCCRFATVSEMAKLQVQEVQIPVPWGHVAGKWWGDCSVQPLLGLHGWEDNANTFDTLAPLLSVPSFLAVDLMGHGLSSFFPAIGAHHFIDAVILLRRIVDHFKWTKFSVVGHSYGSTVAFVYSALYPDDVDAYVSIDCARSLMLVQEENLLDNIRNCLDRTLAIEKRLASDPPKYTYEELLELVYAGSRKSPTRDSCGVLLQRGIKESSQGERMYFLSRDPRLKPWIGALTEDFILACAPRIKCRVLNIRGSVGFLHGDKREEVYLRTLDLMQRSEFYDVDGSHHLHLNNPENVAPLINKFLRGSNL